jgi:hypothetical protein
MIGYRKSDEHVTVMSKCAAIRQNNSKYCFISDQVFINLLINVDFINQFSSFHLFYSILGTHAIQTLYMWLHKEKSLLL